MEREHPIELNEHERIQCLRKIMRPLFGEHFSTLFHGTNEANAKNILNEGLESRANDLSSISIPLFVIDTSYDNQPEECYRKILDWPHHGYKYIVAFMVPNPKEHEPGGMRYFNSVFEELTPDKKVDIGVQGADHSYVIPTQFIRGYIDVNALTLIDNPHFGLPDSLVVRPDPPVSGHNETDTYTSQKESEPNNTDKISSDDIIW